MIRLRETWTGIEGKRMASRVWGFTAVVAAALLAAACGGGGGGDGGGGGTSPPPPPVSPPPSPPSSSFSGTLRAAQEVFVDSDVNDPTAPLTPNNSAASAQALTGGATNVLRILTGFVTKSPTGVAGDAFATMSDESDFFRVTAKANEVVLLDFRDDALSPDDYDPTTGLDLDLYVYDAAGDLLAAVSGSCCSPYELALVPEDGDYIIEVNAYRGTASYVLSVTPELPVPAILPMSGEALLISGELSVEAEPTSDIGRAFVRRHAVSGGLGVGAHLARIDAPARAADVERSTGLRSTSLRTRSRSLRPQAAGRPAPTVDALALIDLVKVLNAHEGQDTFKIMHRHQLDQALPPSDPPNAQLQWNLDRIGWNDAQVQSQIGALPSPLIAVLDDGFFTSHPEMSGIVDERDFVPAADFDGDGTPDDDGYDADAEDRVDPAQPETEDDIPCHVFHGTHVASIAAAPSGNGGMVGVYPGADLMALRLGINIPPFCGALLNFPEAIRYAAGLPNASGALPVRAADVINLSFGGIYTTAAEREAVEDAIAAGVIVVASGGNDGQEGARKEFPHYPAAFDGVIAVGSMSFSNNARAAYSSYYAQIDLLAPGGDTGDVSGDGLPDFILGAVGKLSGGSFTAGYTLYAGTSMAAAHASAGFALMKAIAPDLTATDIDRLLRAGELTSDAGSEDGAGLMRLPKMVAAAVAFDVSGATPTTPPTAAFSPSRMDIGPGLNSASIWVSKVGEGPLSVTSVAASPSTIINGVQTLRVVADEVDANGFGRYLIIANRNSFGSTGGIAGSVEFRLSDGTSKFLLTSFLTGGVLQARTAPVQVKVERLQGASFVTAYEAGVAVGSIVQGASFSVPSLPAGDYRITFSTDIDNDGELCDAGELCGRIPSAFGSNATVALNGSLGNLDVRLAYRTPAPPAP